MYIFALLFSRAKRNHHDQMFVISPAEGLGAGDDVVVIYSARTETNCVTLKRETARRRDVRFGEL